MLIHEDETKKIINACMEVRRILYARRNEDSFLQ